MVGFPGETDQASSILWHRTRVSVFLLPCLYLFATARHRCSKLPDRCRSQSLGNARRHSPNCPALNVWFLRTVYRIHRVRPVRVRSNGRLPIGGDSKLLEGRRPLKHRPHQSPERGADYRERRTVGRWSADSGASAYAKGAGSMKAKSTPPHVHLETFGCQMNEYDSELVRSLMKQDGFVFYRRARTCGRDSDEHLRDSRECPQ